MSLTVLEAAAAAVREGRPAALITVTAASASTPREVGAKMLVHGDGRLEGTVGGGAMEARAIDEARAALAAGAPRTVEIVLSEVDMVCGGSMTVFVEPLVLQPRLLLFGAGHVGQEVAALAARIGLAVHVVDDRPEWANRERFPAAVEICSGGFLAEARRLGVRPSDRIVIVTRGHAHDQEVLEACVDRGAAYLGMIGSRRKVTLALQALRERGVPETSVAAIRAPIGLDLGGDSPAEIAIAVLAEIIAVANDREEIRPLSRR